MKWIEGARKTKRLDQGAREYKEMSNMIDWPNSRTFVLCTYYLEQVMFNFFHYLIITKAYHLACYLSKSLSR